jgi:hypothetical protein
MEARDTEVVLCCLLWANEGLEDDMSAYEDAVLPLIRDHGGEVLQRARGDGADGRPHEVQFYRFPGQAAIDAYIADPRRLALAEERDRVVARTDVFPVELR